MDLLAWWNLIFELPFLGAFLYMLLLATGTVAAGEGGDADVDADVDADADVDHDFDHGIEHSIGGEGHSQSEGSLVSLTLGFLGVGKIPISLLLVSLCTVWGFVGWTANLALGRFIPFPALFVWVSLLLAGVGSVFFTRYLAKALSRLFARSGTYSVDQDDLIGTEGEACYDVTETFGQAQVQDRFGNLHLVDCRIRLGEDTIPKGTAVVLMERRPKDGVFILVTEKQFRETVLQRHP